MTALTFNRIAAKICLWLHDKLLTPGKTSVRHRHGIKMRTISVSVITITRMHEHIQGKVKREDVHSSGNYRFCNIRHP